MRTGDEARSGFTLIEVAVALALLVVALLGFSRTVVSSMVAADTGREVLTATEAAQAVMQRISGATFSDVFALYNDDPNDDPGGVGTAPGPGIDVLGLKALPGDEDGLVGEVFLPTLEVAGDLQLREDAVLPDLGMPRDLNGDATIDSLDHASDYVLLPVRVRFEWVGRSGPAHIEFHTMLTGI